jgi:lipopolysaccharide transport system permease protein
MTAPFETEEKPLPTDLDHTEAVPHRTVTINDATQRETLARSLHELWQYRALIRELVQRDLKMRYKNSLGGMAWSLLNPILQIFVITYIMQFIQAKPIQDYSAYLFGVIFLWGFFQTTLFDGCITILANAQLVRKVYFPRAVLPIVNMLGNLYHFGIAFVFTLIYFFGLGTYPHQLRAEFLLVIPAVFFTAVLSLGLSFILAYLNVLYEDVRFITSVVLQLMFYGLPVFYTIEQVAARPHIYPFYMMNPIAALIVTYQRALIGPPQVVSANGQLLPPVDIPYGYFALACLTSTMILIIGFSLFEKYKWEIAERV